MHMGAMALIGTNCLRNLIHIVRNNGAHETVGSLPTAADRIDLAGIARTCGYPFIWRAEIFEGLDAALAEAKAKKALSFVEVKCALGARADLGRPKIALRENKAAFQKHLREICNR